MAVKVKKTSLTFNQVRNLFASPVIVLPEPAAGYCNAVFSITEKLTYNSVTYAGASGTYYNNSGEIIILFINSVVLLSGATITFPALANAQATPPIITVKNLLITTDAPATLGNSPIDVYVVYETKLIES